MTRRLAVAVALVVFAACVICGMAAENSFAETIRRALIAMFVTLAVALVVGIMGQKMLDENLKDLQKKSGISQTPADQKDR